MAPASNALAENEGLVGSWAVTARIDGSAPEAPPARGLFTFFADGTALRTSSPIALPAGDLPRTLVGATHGEWVATGDHSYGITFVGLLFDENNVFQANQQTILNATFSDAYESFSGPYRVELTDADGNLLATRSGVYQGTRIRVPLDRLP
jgi:hypothetical protein